MAKLFSEFKLKDMTLKNRIVMAPMCMYTADNDGNPNHWHYTHYTSRAVGGTGLIILEATGVESRGRITDKDIGIWKDDHVEALKRIVDGCHSNGAKVGIQLGHAGRKSEVLSEDSIAPSAIAFSEYYRTPIEMTKDDIDIVVMAFKEGARRANQAGFDTIEIHGAHGYLINQFLSPLTNQRTDKYGGDEAGRALFLKEILQAVQAVWPKEKPIILRVSAEEFSEDGNHASDLASIINGLKDDGIDLVNVSTGGLINAGTNTYPGYQVKSAEIIREQTKLAVIAGGLITSPLMAEEILQNERADFVFLGRELLRNPYWPLQAAKELGEDIQWPVQYERGK